MSQSSPVNKINDLFSFPLKFVAMASRRDALPPSSDSFSPSRDALSPSRFTISPSCDEENEHRMALAAPPRLAL